MFHAFSRTASNPPSSTCHQVFAFSYQKLSEDLKRSPVHSMGVYANIVQKQAPKGFSCVYQRLCLNVSEARPSALGIRGYTLEKKYYFRLHWMQMAFKVAPHNMWPLFHIKLFFLFHDINNVIEDSGKFSHNPFPGNRLWSLKKFDLSLLGGLRDGLQ